MPDANIINYIQTQLANGEAKENIVLALKTNGWSESSIQSAFDSLVPPQTQVPSQPLKIFTEKDYPITTLWLFKAPIIWGVVSAVSLLFGYWYPALVILFPYWLIANPLIRKNFHYFLEDQYFVVKQGVLSKKTRNMPYGVIQNVFVKQDLFDRLFGLSTLVIENASQAGGAKFLGMTIGTRKNNQDSIGATDNKVSIPGLHKKDSEALKQLILDKIKLNPIFDKQSGL